MIVIGDVVRLTEGPLDLVECFNPDKNTCPLIGICKLSRAFQRATHAFMDVLEERFAAWELTPAERDVALFAIKGMSTQEIAALREVSEGTIKAQTNAIYRKADVSGRTQLLSLFIDDLMDASSIG